MRFFKVEGNVQGAPARVYAATAQDAVNAHLQSLAANDGPRLQAVPFGSRPDSGEQWFDTVGANGLHGPLIIVTEV